MQTFFFDMKDGVPMRDRVGIEFSTNAEAIIHCKELAQHWRDESLCDDKDLENLGGQFAGARDPQRVRSPREVSLPQLPYSLIFF